MWLKTDHSAGLLWNYAPHKWTRTGTYVYYHIPRLYFKKSLICVVGKDFFFHSGMEPSIVGRCAPVKLMLYTIRCGHSRHNRNTIGFSQELIHTCSWHLQDECCIVLESKCQQEFVFIPSSTGTEFDIRFHETECICVGQHVPVSIPHQESMFVCGIFFAGFTLEQVHFVYQGYVVVAVGHNLTAATEVWNSGYALCRVKMCGDCGASFNIVLYHFCRVGPFHISVGLIKHWHPVLFTVGIVGTRSRNASTQDLSHTGICDL